MNQPDAVSVYLVRLPDGDREYLWQTMTCTQYLTFKNCGATITRAIIYRPVENCFDREIHVPVGETLEVGGRPIDPETLTFKRA